MGKSLRGKECGKGICQRKDGLYCARFVWSCVILFLSTGEQESQRRTVPMIPTYISSAMKQGSNTFVCTPCDIPMLQEQSKAVCSRRCCKSSGSCQHQNNNGSVCSCDEWFHVKSRITIWKSAAKPKWYSNGTVSAVQVPKTLEK